MWIESAPKGFQVFDLPNGDKAFVHETVTVGQVTMGRFSYINPRCVLQGKFPIRIGAFCSLASDIYCFTYEGHQTRYVSTFPLRTMLGVDVAYPEVVEKPQGVTIGNDVWIGQQVRIMPGVTIGDGCVIGARAVVTKDCAPYGIYVGVPAKLARKRFPDPVIDQLLRLKWWEWPLERIRRNAAFFSTDLASFEGELATLVVA